MAQFQVPQFIETEDKIVGPLTLRQTLYIAGAGLILFLTFFILKTFLWFILAAFIGTAAAIMAFVKFNGQPMHRAVAAMLKYVWQPRFYLWKPAQEEAELPEVPKIKTPKAKLPKVEATAEIPLTARAQSMPQPKFVPPAAQAPIETTVETPPSARVEAVPTPVTVPMPEVAPTMPAPKAAAVAGQAMPRVTVPPATPVEPEKPRQPLLKSLWFKLQTGAQSIRPAAKEKSSEEQYAIIRKITGEREKVRRVDYR